MGNINLIRYTVNQSSQEEIKRHLLLCNEDFLIPLSERVNIDDYSAKIRSYSITFEAWCEKELVGLISCYANNTDRNIAFITNVSVLDSHRKKGIAQALFKKLFGNEIVCSFKKIEIKVFKNDIPTINLYKKNSFIEREQEHDQIVMERFLSNKEPLVSISCITYNHERYIRRCLDGFLMQKANFAFEILIHDDASTDGTADIIREYEEKYPAIIKPIYQTDNQYSKGVSISATFNWPRAKGKYIAMCEGDDYWVDVLKLQKQVDVLQKNPNINICSHPSLRLYGEEVRKDGYGFWGDKEKIIPAKEVILNYSNTAPLQSMLFRNYEVDKISQIIKKLLGGHSSLQIFYSIPDGLYYLPDYMSVYRVASASSISKVLFRNDKEYLVRQKKNWKGLDLLNESSNYIFNDDFNKAKQIRSLNAIKTGYLTNIQLITLIFNYKLYKAPRLLINAVRHHNKIKRKKVD